MQQPVLDWEEGSFEMNRDLCFKMNKSKFPGPGEAIPSERREGMKSHLVLLQPGMEALKEPLSTVLARFCTMLSVFYSAVVIVGCLGGWTKQK